MLEEPAASDDPKLQSAKEAYQLWVDRLEGAAVGIVQGPGQAVPGQAAPGAPAPGAPPFTQSPRVASDTRAVSLTLGPRQEQELARLQRDNEIHQKTYLEMKQRLEQGRITQRLGQSDEGTKFRIIEPARLPLRPFFPNLFLFFFGSLLLGIMVGTTAAFASEYLDDSLQTAEDVQTVLAVPVLGSISTIVTPEDVAARRRRMRSWISLGRHAERARTRVVQPVADRVDKALVRWGL